MVWLPKQDLRWFKYAGCKPQTLLTLSFANRGQLRAECQDNWLFPRCEKFLPQEQEKGLIFVRILQRYKVHKTAAPNLGRDLLHKVTHAIQEQHSPSLALMLARCWSCLFRAATDRPMPFNQRAITTASSVLQVPQKWSSYQVNYCSKL